MSNIDEIKVKLVNEFNQFMSVPQTNAWLGKEAQFYVRKPYCMNDEEIHRGRIRTLDIATVTMPERLQRRGMLSWFVSHAEQTILSGEFPIDRIKLENVSHWGVAIHFAKKGYRSESDMDSDGTSMYKTLNQKSD